MFADDFANDLFVATQGISAHLLKDSDAASGAMMALLFANAYKICLVLTDASQRAQRSPS